MIRFTVNGVARTAEPVGPESLLFTLRERLGLWGTKGACEQGVAGSRSGVERSLVVHG